MTGLTTLAGGGGWVCEEGGCECVGGGTAVIGVGVNGFLGSSSLSAVGVGLAAGLGLGFCLMIGGGGFYREGRERESCMYI